MTNIHRKAVALLATSVAVIGETPTMAQQAPAARSEGLAPESNVASGGLEDIVVTARRVSEKLQNVPVAVTAISTNTLRTQNIVDIAGLQRVAPSFTVTISSRGNSTPSYMIRGQRAISINTLIDTPVAIYFADVGQSLPTGTNFALYDIASVEVLKGPQGTLFGRNTTGGAVVIAPKAPSNKFEGYAQVTAGSYSLRDFEGVLNMPISDNLALRLGGKVRRRDGYLYNPVRQDYAENEDSNSARVSLRWSPSTSFETTTIGTYFRDDVAYGSKPFAIDPAGLPAAFGALNAILGAQLIAAFAQTQALGKYEIDDAIHQHGRDTVHSIQNISTLKLGGTFIGNTSLKNIFGYRSVRTVLNSANDGIPFSITTAVPQTISLEQTSDEFQLITDSGDLSTITGLFYNRSKGRETTYSVQFPSLAPIVPSTFPLVSRPSYDTDNRSYAAFSHFNYKLDRLLQGLAIAAGARITKDERNVVYHNRSGNGFNATSFTCVTTGATRIPDDDAFCSSPGKVSFTQPTYDASLSYQASRNVLLYATFRHGYRTGGFNTSPPSAAAIPSTVVKPEKIDDVELGLKTDFSIGDTRGRFNIAAYHDNYKNVQRQGTTLLPSGAIVSLLTNAAKATIDGGEAELTLNPTRRLTLSVNGALIHTRYRDWTVLYTSGAALLPVDVSASKFSHVPKFQLNASIGYDLPLPQRVGVISIHASYYHQSGIQTADINSSDCGPDGKFPNCRQAAGALPGYSLGNARIDWRDVAGRGFDLALSVENVTNKFYNPSAVANGLGALGESSVTIGPPRRWSVEFRVPFGASAY